MATGTGGVAVRTLLDTGGRDGLVRRMVEVPAGARFEGTAGPGGELWFVIAGLGWLAAEGGPDMPVRPDTGVWLPPGTRYRLAAGGPGGGGRRAGAGAERGGGTSRARGREKQSALRLDSVSLPRGGAGQDGPSAPQLSELTDCPVEVTGDRQFRVVFGPGNGCGAATQFVGEIPPGRAPPHSHTYDEVVLVLAGEGVLHAGPADRPLAPGSCVHLPPGQPHCLENTGRATLRVLGVFHPGGSPAAKVTAPDPG
jgi:quercetin dioxygenase-like cupin family protein